MKFKHKEMTFIGYVVTSEGLKPEPEKVKAVVQMPNPTDGKGYSDSLGFSTISANFFQALMTNTSPYAD